MFFLGEQVSWEVFSRRRAGGPLCPRQRVGLAYACCGVCGTTARGEAASRAVVSGFCALQASVVEELSAFMFRTKSLCKIPRQKNFFAFNPKNVRM